MKTCLIVFLLVPFFALTSCKKFIQAQEKKAVLQIMTNGVWYVDSYIANDSDVTASFSGYVFQFREDGTVSGILNTVSTSGVWSADINNRSILSSFPGAPQPLSRLNASWKIKDSGNDFVKANSPDPADTTLLNVLSLKKK